MKQIQEEKRLKIQQLADKIDAAVEAPIEDYQKIVDENKRERKNKKGI